MIFKEPVLAPEKGEGKTRKNSLTEWLELGNFPPGIAGPAAEEKPGSPEELLKGFLLYITKGEGGRGERGAAKILASLQPYAETAAFSAASKVPYLLKNSFRLQTNEDDKTELDLLEEVDVLVLAGVSHLTEMELHEVDSFVARRAYGPPKVTVVIVAKTMSYLPQAEEIYGEGRVRWV
jgi:hypothetical protein